MNLFEYAARRKLRFPSIRGILTSEELFDLPLTARDGFDLDGVAKRVNADLKAAGEESFVAERSSPVRDELSIKLDIVKHVIAVKLAEQAEARNAAAKKQEREKLLAILADKKDEALKGLSAEEIEKRLAALGG